MDVLLSKKTALKRRASLSLLFGSQVGVYYQYLVCLGATNIKQKPTFATLNDKPTRYYDFVDTPALRKPATPLIDRQDIPPELESKIKYACSLLAYRVEQGVPSPPRNQIQRRTTRAGFGGQMPAKAQLESKYSASKMGTQTGYDSGVSLTQQPSMQTMRVLNSRSGDASDSSDTRTVSIFSNTTRTGTSCSNTSAINSTTQSPKQNGNELQSMTGEDVPGHAQYQDCDTKAFLTEASQPLSSHPMTNISGHSPSTTNNRVEVFLKPDITTITNLSSETLSSHPSPSLGLSRVPAHQCQPSNLRDSYQAQEEGQDPNIIGLGTTCTNNEPHHGRSRSIIIDSDGRARLLSPDEESQRNKALQQAVLAKMTSGFMKYNPIPIRQPSERRRKESTSSVTQDEQADGNKRHSRLSQLGLLRPFMETEGSSTGIENDKQGGSNSKRSVLRRKLRLGPGSREDEEAHQKESGGVSVLKKVGRKLFSRKRGGCSPT
ncbi:hypothetical protein BJX62DRAFT_181003 [Aspergillus germanicus]